MKDAAQDGSVKVLVLSIAIFQWRWTGSRGPSSSTLGCVHVRPPVRDDDGTLDPPPAPPPPPPPPPPARSRTLRRTSRRTWRRTWPSGPGRRVPSLPRHHRRRRRLCAARAEMGAQLGSSVAFAVLGAQLGSSVAFGSGFGEVLPGVPRKAPLGGARAWWLRAAA